MIIRKMKWEKMEDIETPHCKKKSLRGTRGHGGIEGEEKACQHEKNTVKMKI